MHQAEKQRINWANAPVWATAVVAAHGHPDILVWVPEFKENAKVKGQRMSDKTEQLVTTSAEHSWYLVAQKPESQPTAKTALAGLPGWSRGWEEQGFNYCLRHAAAALRFLADHDRPSGGSDRFNAEDLLDTASALELTQRELLLPLLAVRDVAAKQPAFKYKPDYVAAWPDKASERLLQEHGIEKAVHLTTFFDGFGQMASLQHAPWDGPKDARIARVVEWAVGDNLYLIAELDQCEWSQDINAFYRAQGAREDLPHEPHLNLKKRVPAGTAAQFQALVGKTIRFYRHGAEQPVVHPHEPQGNSFPA